MPTFLLKAETVHIAAGLCDYLDTRALETYDVGILTLSETSDRDLGDIENVLQVRTGMAGTIQTVDRSGDPGEIIPTVAREIGADEIILPHDRGSTGGKDHISEIIANASRPIVLVPITEPS